MVSYILIAYINYDISFVRKIHPAIDNNGVIIHLSRYYDIYFSCFLSYLVAKTCFKFVNTHKFCFTSTKPAGTIYPKHVP